MPNETFEKRKPGQEMRITPDEMSLIKNTFAGNDELLKLLRKIFLPYLDPSLPLLQNIDLWMTIPLDGLTPEDIAINVKARNSLIQHIEQQLNVLHILAGEKVLSIEEAMAKLKTDSTK